MKTTDPQNEIFPIVDENDKVIGKIIRYEAHKSPQIIHRAAIILIFDKQERFLIQKRSLTKDTSPGYWSCSLGGHVGYDERYLDVAVRETKEELGVTLKPEDFKFLGKIITSSPQEREMTTVYKVVLNKIPEMCPNPEEVTEVRFVNMETLKKMLKNEKWTSSSIQVIDKFMLLSN